MPPPREGRGWLRRARRLVAWGLALAGAVLAASFANSELRLRRRYEFEVQPVSAAPTPAAIARGRHLAHHVAQCAHCHGDDLGGRMAADDFMLGRLYAPNLTSGRGGVAALDDDADLVRAIRHGVDRDGRPLLIMPAQYLRHLSDRDLGALIAYLRTLPPVDRTTPRRRVGPLTRLAMLAGFAPELLPAEEIDHDAPLAPAPAATLAEGRYLVDLGGCRVCHRPGLSGGLHPLAVPGEPEPPNLTPTGPLASWSEREFIRTLRTGMTPRGHALDARFMPWPRYAGMSDAELRAIWLYLRSVPSRS